MKMLLVMVGVFFAATVCAQQSSTTDNFPPPGQASFIYHPTSKSLLLIGCIPVSPDSLQSNVWKLDGNSWSEIKANGPGSRDFFPAALNTKTGFIYAFGGVTIPNEIHKGDLWSFDGKKWSLVSADNIGSRDHHSFVYADHLDAFVIYGGQFGDNTFDTTTWLLKDGKIIPLRIPGPGIRYHSALAYDKHRKKVVLYGGGEHPDEHWEFDGEKWTKIKTKENPGKKLYHLMVYDDNLKMIILHGGWQNQDPRDPINKVTPVTWGWNGSEWKKIAEQRIFPGAMGYDADRKKVVAFGRSDNAMDGELGLWELENGKWIMIANYGKWSAYEHLKKWVQQNPDDMQALMKYADMLQWQTKEFNEAELAYKKLEAVYPEKKEMLIDLALVLSMQSKMEEAELYLAKVKDAGLLNRNVYLRLAGLLQMENKYREAITYLEKALAMEAKGIDFYHLACNYLSIDNKDKAFENLNKAVDNGYNSKQEFENAADLSSLKQDSRWQEVLKKLK